MRNQSFLALSIAALVLVACDDDAPSGPRALSGRCGSDTDCQPGLVCELRICHQPCVADPECAGAARCVRRALVTDAGPFGGVCQLVEETQCEVAADCAGRQLCGNGECRDGCSKDTDCLQGQRCLDGKVCVSTDPSKDSAQ